MSTAVNEPERSTSSTTVLLAASVAEQLRSVQRAQITVLPNSTASAKTTTVSSGTLIDLTSGQTSGDPAVTTRSESSPRIQGPTLTWVPPPASPWVVLPRNDLGESADLSTVFKYRHVRQTPVVGRRAAVSAALFLAFILGAFIGLAIGRGIEVNAPTTTKPIGLVFG
jgi:hypothetical protein